jgi:ATP-dependent phosphofructokinase / diphosphate-dependent phosphofructokinase
MERVCDLLNERRGREVQYSIIVVSEGATMTVDREFCKNNKVDEFGHRALGGIAAYIAEEIEGKTGLETRYVILSHLQRGGSPSARDRIMARWFGIAAVDMIVNEDFGRMVSYLHGEITSVPMKDVTDHLKLINVAKYYDTERYNGKRSIL